MTHSSPTDPNQAHSLEQPEEQPADPQPTEALNPEAQATPALSSSGLLVPPEEQLTAPPTSADTPENVTEQATEVSVSPWLVVTKNRRVNRDWEALLLRAPENARRCYEDLCNAPTVRKPKRVFPLNCGDGGILQFAVCAFEITITIPLLAGKLAETRLINSCF